MNKGSKRKMDKSYVNYFLNEDIGPFLEKKFFSLVIRMVLDTHFLYLIIRIMRRPFKSHGSCLMIP